MWTEGAVFEALKNRYKSPEYALLPQVRNQTGFGRVTRTADAIAMSLWPSRGLTLSGFEIKVHRGDWLSELRNPAKSCEIQQYCDEWWVVSPAATETGGLTIVLPDEVPATWGLITVSEKGRLRVVKQAPPLKPVEISKKFLAAILRGIEKYEAPLDAVEAAHRRGVKEGIKGAGEEHERQLRRVTEERDGLRNSIHEFQRASGFSLEYCGQSGRIGKAVRLFMDNGECDRMRSELLRLLATTQRVFEGIQSSLKDLDDNVNRES